MGRAPVTLWDFEKYPRSDARLLAGVPDLPAEVYAALAFLLHDTVPTRDAPLQLVIEPTKASIGRPLDPLGRLRPARRGVPAGPRAGSRPAAPGRHGRRLR